MTRIVKVRGPLDPGVGEAARIIARGGIAVIPTETLYGLATNPLHGDAVEKVYLAKKRSPSKPLIVLASTPRAAASLVKWEPRAEKLAKTFWPGPLTIVLPAKPSTPPSLRGGGDTLGVRVPGNPVTLAILARAGGLATGTSANLSGEPPPRKVEEISPEILGAADIVVDAGPLPGTPSTLIRIAGGVEVLREGAVPAWRIREAIGDPAP